MIATHIFTRPFARVMWALSMALLFLVVNIIPLSAEGAAATVFSGSEQLGLVEPDRIGPQNDPFPFSFPLQFTELECEVEEDDTDDRDLECTVRIHYADLVRPESFSITAVPVQIAAQPVPLYLLYEVFRL